MTATGSNHPRNASMTGFTLTTHRVRNRRAVVWLGQTCNLRCYFCYFLDKINAKDHPEHPMMPMHKARAMCKTLVDYYGCNSVDIQGGEPLVWGGIYDLVAYCAEIGLKPTLITNGIQLAKRELCERLKRVGVYDLLFSIHGLGETYDRIVGMPGGSEKQSRALENLREVGIPFRLNCVLSKPVVQQLPELAELTFRSGARAMNFIAFNPFVDQTSGKRTTETVASYSEVMKVLTPILDEFDRRGVECNVRYFPFCVFEKRHRKFCQNFQQIIYDLHEWDVASEFWTALPAQRQAALPLSPPIALDESIWVRRQQWARRAAIRWVDLTHTRPLARLVLKGFQRPRPEQGVPVHLHLPGGNLAGAGEFGPPLPVDRLHPVWSRIGRATEGLLKLGREWLLGEERLPRQEYLNRQARRLMPLAVHTFEKCGACRSCDLSPICDGFHGDYAAMFTYAEASPVKLGRRIRDPKYYMGEQRKVVEEQEYHWALGPGDMPPTVPAAEPAPGG